MVKGMTDKNFSSLCFLNKNKLNFTYEILRVWIVNEEWLGSVYIYISEKKRVK